MKGLLAERLPADLLTPESHCSCIVIGGSYLRCSGYLAVKPNGTVWRRLPEKRMSGLLFLVSVGTENTHHVFVPLHHCQCVRLVSIIYNVLMTQRNYFCILIPKMRFGGSCKQEERLEFKDRRRTNEPPVDVAAHHFKNSASPADVTDHTRRHLSKRSLPKECCVLEILRSSVVTTRRSFSLFLFVLTNNIQHKRR